MVFSSLKKGAAKKASAIASHAHALELCLYCPNLCRQACPVATAAGNDTFSPHRLMSLAAHVRDGRVPVDEGVAKTLHACTACGACTAACLHDNPVGDVLVEARASLVEAGVSPIAVATIDRPTLPADHPFCEDLRQQGRYEERPAVSFVPGRLLIERDPGAVLGMFGMCERLDVEPLACGELARIDPGLELWHHGHHGRFADRAKSVAAAAEGARDVVVWSPEAFYLMKVVYPRFGVRVPGELAHISEYLLPVLSGAFVKRLSGRVGYHESYVTRRAGLGDVPRQVLKRVLAGSLVELPAQPEIQGASGVTGLEPLHLELAALMADRALTAALELGLERLVSFSAKEVFSLRDAAALRPEASALRIDHAVTLVAEAVKGDGVG